MAAPPPPPGPSIRKEAADLPEFLRGKVFTKDKCIAGQFGKGGALDEISMSDPQVAAYLRQNCRNQILVSIDPAGRVVDLGSKQVIFPSAEAMLAATYAECDQNRFFDGAKNAVYMFENLDLPVPGMQGLLLRQYLSDKCAATGFLKFKKDIYPWLGPLLKLLQERRRTLAEQRAMPPPKITFLEFLWDIRRLYPKFAQDEYRYGYTPIDASVEVMFRRILDSDPGRLGEIETVLRGMNNARTYEDVNRYIYALTNHSKVDKVMEENYRYTLGDNVAAEVGFRVFEANPTWTDVSDVHHPIFETPRFSQVVSRQPTSDSTLAAENYINDIMQETSVPVPGRPADKKIFIKQTYRLREKTPGLGPNAKVAVIYVSDGGNYEAEIKNLPDGQYDFLTINLDDPQKLLVLLGKGLLTVATRKMKPTGKIKFNSNKYFDVKNGRSQSLPELHHELSQIMADFKPLNIRANETELQEFLREWKYEPDVYVRAGSP